MKKFVYILFLLAIPLSTHAFTFTRTLTIGSEGEDVSQLQKFLNSNPATQVSTEGVGSLGNESTYFGKKTKDAVVKFQNLYAQNILIPNGLSSGTGIVGTSTLNFLNSIQTKISTSTPMEQDILNQPLHPQSTSTPQFFISKKTIQPGEKFSVGSFNIISTADFFLNSIPLKKKCFTDFTCELSTEKNLKADIYSIRTSDPLLQEGTITVLDSSLKKPKIKNKKLKIIGENVIKGKNFGENMTIYSMFGVFKTQTRNNSFILEFPATYTSWATTTINGLFYIENENGLTSDILNIRYEI
jgi:hypothetical protein